MDDEAMETDGRKNGGRRERKEGKRDVESERDVRMEDHHGICPARLCASRLMNHSQSSYACWMQASGLNKGQGKRPV